MTATAEYYLDLLEQAGLDTESLTVLVASGAGPEQVAEALALDLARPITPDEYDVLDGVDHTAWSLVEVTGGVLAVEGTGYGDPSPRSLATASSNGRSVAVARSNIQAHERFGCARDGVLSFDEDEFMYAEDPASCPPELRRLFDSAWVDLSAEQADDDAGIAGIFTGVAMVEQWTGVQLAVEDFVRLQDSPAFLARTQVYLD